MAQAYIDPKRADDPYALPDVEVFEATTAESPCCDTSTMVDYACRDSDAVCRTCERSFTIDRSRCRDAWWYWFCSPGCLPDSDPMGPFESEAEALDECQMQRWLSLSEDDDDE